MKTSCFVSVILDCLKNHICIFFQCIFFLLKSKDLQWAG